MQYPMRSIDAVKKIEHLRLIKPVVYFETLKLVKNARFLLTDSGGLQKEAFWLKTPCITLRDNTEWIETVQLGANFLTGANANRIMETAREIMDKRQEIRERIRESSNPFGNGKASIKIVDIIRTST